MHKFEAEIAIIGVNPFVFVPEPILISIFKQAGKDKGAIPIKGKVNDKPYKQTLLRYKGYWRLYINTTILKNSPKRVGEIIVITVEFDPSDRSIKPHPEFKLALKKNKQASKAFNSLIPSRKKEVLRYLSNLKTEESRKKNIARAIKFLSGKASFAGRDKP